MTPTEKKYLSYVGKIYTVPVDGYSSSHGFETLTMLMPHTVRKQYGWWFFYCEALNNKGLYYDASAVRYVANTFIKECTLLDIKKVVDSLPVVS